MQEGVTAEGVQKAICDGLPYGRKEYTAAEREAACQRYEELTGIAAPRARPDYTMHIAGSVVTVFLLAVFVWYIFYKRKATKNLRQKTRSSKIID